MGELHSCGLLLLRVIHIHTVCHLSDKRGASQVALMVKNPPANAGGIRDMGSISGSGRSPGEGNGNPFQYSCLENPTDRADYSS